MIAAALLLSAASADPIAGTWEGTSLCQVKPSPCHDEHVVYQATILRRGVYRFAMYKIVSGEEQFMGNIDLRPDPGSGALAGTTVDRAGQAHPWTFVRRGAHLSGKLTGAPGGPIYRLIEVTKR